MAAEEALLKRVLPHSIEAEQSVIGCMILSREAITVAADMLQEEDFYNRQYGVVFQSIVEPGVCPGFNAYGADGDPYFRLCEDRLGEGHHAPADQGL